MRDSKNSLELVNNSNKYKLKRWLEILCLGICIFVMMKVLSYYMDPIRFNRPDWTYDRDKTIVTALTEEPNSIDVLIVGDSEGMVLFSPIQLMDEAGISSYVFAETGQRIEDTYCYLKRLMDRQHPSLVILEPNIVTHDTTFNLELLLSFETLAREEFPVLRYHNNWSRMIGLEEANKYTAYRGYEVRDLVEPYTGGEYMIETDERANVDMITMIYLDKIRQLCEDEGVPMIIVSSPSPVCTNYSKHNTIQDYADKHNIEFIDFNLMLDEIGIDWETDSYDNGDHINANGTQKTTKYIIKYLDENYDLKDHREE